MRRALLRSIIRAANEFKASRSWFYPPALPHLVYVLSAWCYTITFEQAGGVMGKKSLGVGGRSGVYSADFARRGASRVVGIDFSNNMLKLAAKKAEQHQVTDRCTFIEADAGWQVLLNALNVKD